MALPDISQMRAPQQTYVILTAEQVNAAELEGSWYALQLEGEAGERVSLLGDDLMDFSPTWLARGWPDEWAPAAVELLAWPEAVAA